MNKVAIVKAIVKGYFLAALAGSFTHVIESAHKVGLTGWEAGITPFLIDGMFVISMVMRSEEFSRRTRRDGFAIQVIMGAMSLTANVYAATHLGGVILAGMLVGGMVFGEWLVGRIQSASVDVIADAEAATRQAAVDAQAKKDAAIAKGKATRARNARTRKADVKALERLVK